MINILKFKLILILSVLPLCLTRDIGVFIIEKYGNINSSSPLQFNNEEVASSKDEQNTIWNSEQHENIFQIEKNAKVDLNYLIELSKDITKEHDIRNIGDTNDEHISEEEIEDDEENRKSRRVNDKRMNTKYKNETGNSTKRPHIIFIMADDLGYNDVSFHGENAIPTPNIDALAYSGVTLQNYYVCPICTPSRSALMTGKYPIHTGMQHTVLFGAERRGLPLNLTILPQHLARLGYSRRIVGKWHLGSYKKKYTPTYRGFESHVGFWTGHHDYNDHTAMETGMWGLDARRDLHVAYEAHGKYSTDWFTDEAVHVIEEHKKKKDPRPMFLYVAHAAVHSGNPYNPLAAPDNLVANFSHIDEYNRRKFAAILTKLDDSVGKIIQALSSNSMLQDSIVIFSSDNGGPAAGFNLNAASNWPLRGVKNTLWEGGVKGAALLFSPSLVRPNRAVQQLMHVSDWLPTLYRAAGGDVRDLGDIDGVDQWDVLSEDKPTNRTEILHNIDDTYGNSAVMVHGWKLVKGTSYGGEWDGWYGPSDREGTYSFSQVTSSTAGQALKAIGRLATPQQIAAVRNSSNIHCGNQTEVTCQPLKAPCVFNVNADPCERTNLADKYPEILSYLLDRLNKYNATAVPPGNLPVAQEGDPKHWNYVWANFGDYEVTTF